MTPRLGFPPFFLLFPLVFSCCASSAAPESPALPLRYPVILVNGLAIRDGKGAGTWGRIPAFLRNRGADLYFGGTDAWGRFETNAELLKRRVEEALRETGKDRVNIIAHSAGGIGARYMIWYYGLGAQVASLTTVSTPHQGSELADFVYDREITHSSFIKNLFKRIGERQGDEKPEPYELGFALTPGAMKKFNARVPPDPQVYYLTIYSTIDNYWDDPRYGWCRRYLDRTAGPNDGMVSEESTRWYGERVKAGDNISHLEILDHRRTNTSGEDIIKIYRGILEKLVAHGF
jgi:triacylglycerol lipase